MSRFIVKITDDLSGKDYYLQWSSVPATFGMPLSEFKQFYLDEYGEVGRKMLEDQLPLVESFGSSEGNGKTALDAIKQSNLDKEVILDNYCRNWIR